MADPKKLATSFVTSTAAPISFLGRHSHALAAFKDNDKDKAMTSVVIHGAYKVRAPEPCFIVELTIKASEEELSFSEVLFDANIAGVGVRTQAPFNEHFVSMDGNEVLGDYTYGWDHPEIWKGDVRIVFLMHFLKPGGSIKTPYGNVEIPKFTSRPERLKKINYVSPY